MRTGRHRRDAGFSLIELAIGLVIVATLLSSLLVPLVTQLDQKRTAETQRLLEQAREALIGFAAANNRLPCPATGATGNESFAVGGTATTGACDQPTGRLPGVTLGLSPLDAQGFYVDAFASDLNRIRYAVSGQMVNGVTNPFTRINGMKNATMTAIAASSSLLFVCSATPAASNCGTATALANGTAIALVFSPGKNAILNAPSADELENTNTDNVFVSRTYSDRTGGTSTVFDDQMLWLSPAPLFSRLLSAGALP